MRSRGIEYLRGDSEAEIPGQTVIIPDGPGRIRVRDMDMNRLRRGLVKKAAAMVEHEARDDALVGFLAEETQMSPTEIAGML